MFFKTKKPYLNVGNRLKCLRTSKGLYQADLAYLTGIPLSTIQLIEECSSGKETFVPNLKVGMLLATALDCQVSDIFFFEEIEK